MIVIVMRFGNLNILLTGKYPLQIYQVKLTLSVSKLSVESCEEGRDDQFLPHPIGPDGWSYHCRAGREVGQGLDL